jgi:hypothetical protein
MHVLDLTTLYRSLKQRSLVRELRGLTEEEIAIVEGAAR